MVCNGATQLKVVAALHDACQLAGTARGNYLARSADLLRSTVVPPLPTTNNHIDIRTLLVFTEQVPQYFNKDALGDAPVKRVRNLF